MHKPPRPRPNDDHAAMKSIDAAGNAAMRNDWRLCADSYLAAYRTCSDTWDRWYISWSGYTSVLREGNVDVIESDLQALEEVANNERAPMHHRVQAFFTYGFVANAELRDASASAYGYQSAIDVGTRALAAIRASAADTSVEPTVLMAMPDGYGPLPVSRIVHELLDYAEPNLKLVRRASSSEHQHSPQVVDRAQVDGGAGELSNAISNAISDVPVVRTASALEYAHTYYEIAMRKRDELLETANRRRGRLGRAGAVEQPLLDDDREDGRPPPPTTEEAVAVGVGADGGVSVARGAALSSSAAFDDAGTLAVFDDAGTLAFETPLPMPQPAPRECHVHSCVLLADDHECLASGGCDVPLGHLAPMGGQFAELVPITERWLASSDRRSTEPSPSPAALSATDRVPTADALPTVDALGFWDNFVARYVPLVVRGGARAAMVGAQPWDDAFLTAHCKLATGRPWRALIEKNNRITQNDRHPLMYDWTFCDFMSKYRTAEYQNMLYVVTPLSERGVTLRNWLLLPEALRCSELFTSLGEARLWMSGGNTTSSLHFDTHENYMLQLDGSKDVFMWHPNESHKFYSDFHNKFGLSPVSADYVDLERYPEFGNSAPLHATVHAGDAFYIPDGYWHLIVSHGPRNVAVALEFSPWTYDEMGHWPADVAERYQWPGLFWAESVSIKYAMRERYGASRYVARQTKRPVVCEELAPIQPFSQLSWLGQEH